MPMKEQFNSLLEYNFYTTQMLLDQARELPVESLENDPLYGRGSIFNILLHLLITSHSWRSGLETRSRQPFPNSESYRRLDDLQKGLQTEQAAWQAYLDGLREQELDGKIELTSSQGNLVIDRWRIIQHVVPHGMQHHSEIARLLTNNRQSPGDIDYIFFRGK